MMKKTALALVLALVLGSFSSAASADASAEETKPLEAAEITVFAAKSLNAVMEDLITAYREIQPDVKILGSYDSSGTLMTQIEEGARCDVFFSAAQKQMNELEEKEFLIPGSRRDVVNNQVCVVTYDGSGTKVTGLKNMNEAASLALADGSVPVGKYTREALVAIGTLEGTEDNSRITAEEVSAALGGVEINSCANVGAVAAAVSEGSNEVGTVYYSDTYGYEEKLEILEIVPYELTGNVIYPVAQIASKEATDAESAAAADFVEFLLSDEAKTIFESYHFDTNIEKP